MVEERLNSCYLRLLLGAIVVAFAAAASLSAQGTAIELEPIASGLNQPVFLTNAHDGSNRRFIVEQAGRIEVLLPGSSTPALFLDITDKVAFGGERGLLGLTFHPQFAANGRYFVDYTRRPDGATVIAEYRAGSAAEKVLLTIPQPFENHNGGMVEFGPDGFLYIGMGDGGAGNDPDARAQNRDELLGKILRIDVDHPQNAQVPYSSPASNPFVGNIPGRDEIFAYGMRNPWRFAFDRADGLLWVADVGQDAVEEIDIVRLGGNYGWRIWEGSHCTGLGPASCSGPGFIPPIAEYAHTNGRCSITGGYVYRGTQQSLPFGTYVFGDYCTGEIFLLKDGVQTLLLDSPLNISSFGEDESGELYVLGLDGSVFHIRKSASQTVVSSSGFSIQDLGYNSVSTDGGRAEVNVGYSRIQKVGGTVLPSGLAIIGYRPGGVLVTESAEPASPLISSGTVYAEFDPPVNTGIAIANPNTQAVSVVCDMTFSSGLKVTSSIRIPAGGQVAAFLNQPPFFQGLNSGEGAFHIVSPEGLVSVVALRSYLNERSEMLLSVLPVIRTDVALSGSPVIPHFAVGGGWRTKVALVNPANVEKTGTVELRLSTGQSVGIAPYTVPPDSAISFGIQAQQLDDPLVTGSIRLSAAPGSQAPSGVAIFTYGKAGVTVTEAAVAALPAGNAFQEYVETAGNFPAGSEGSIQAGLAIANTVSTSVTVNLELAGAQTSIVIPSNGQTTFFLNQIPGFAGLPVPLKGVLRITSKAAPISVMGLRAHYNERGEMLVTTAVPVNEDTPVNSSELLFPHIVDGGGYTTQFVLFGSGTGGTVYYLDQHGEPSGVLLH